MADNQNNDERAFSSKDLEAFLKRLRIPVTSETIAKAFEIDFAMRRGQRGAAETAARELMEIFRASQDLPTEDDFRQEHNANALDREAPVDDLIGKALSLYENMQITLQDADPEESTTEVYSADLYGRMLRLMGVEENATTVDLLEKAALEYQRYGRTDAKKVAKNLVTYLASQGQLPDPSAQSKLVDKIIETIESAEFLLDTTGDPGTVQDLDMFNERPEDYTTDDVTMDLGTKVEDDERAAQEAAELQRRTWEEYGAREQESFQNLARRADGLIASLGLDPANPEDQALMDEMAAEMRAFALLQGGPSGRGIQQMTDAMNRIQNLADRLTARLGADAGVTAESLNRQIVQEASAVTHLQEAELQNLERQAEATVRAQIQQEAVAAANEDGADTPEAGKLIDPAKTTDMDVRKVAQALSDNGRTGALKIATQIAENLREDENVPIPVDQIAEDLVARAIVFNQENEAFERQEQDAEIAARAALNAKNVDQATDAPVENTDAATPAPTDNSDIPSEIWINPQFQGSLRDIAVAQGAGETDRAKASIKEALSIASAISKKENLDFTLSAKSLLVHVFPEKVKSAKTADVSETTNPATPSLSDYQEDLERISFLLAEGNAQEARAEASTLAATMRGFGGAFAQIDAKMILKYVIKDDKKKADARAAAGQNDAVDDEDEDPSDRAAWFLSMALRKDDQSTKLYQGLVRALLLQDRSTAGKLAKALANHIYALYNLKLPLVDLMTAIVTSAKMDADAQTLDKTTTDVSDVTRSDHSDEDPDEGAAAGILSDTETEEDPFPTEYGAGAVKLDLSLAKKVDWVSVMDVYKIDPSESGEAEALAKMIVKKGKENTSVLKSAKDLLARSSKSVKGAKVKNHKHFAAAVEDAMILKSQSKKVVKPLKFADIADDESIAV